MIRLLLVLPLLLASLSSMGCATILNGTTERIDIQTTPSGARVLVLPEGTVATTPVRLDLERKQAHTLRLSKDGYEPEFVYLDRVGSGAINGNLILGGLIGISVDTSTGGAFQLIPKEVDVTLSPLAPPDESERDAAPAEPSAE